MTSGPFRASGEQIDRAQTHYAGLVEELAGRALLSAQWVRGRHWAVARWNDEAGYVPAALAYVPRHAAEETP